MNAENHGSREPGGPRFVTYALVAFGGVAAVAFVAFIASAVMTAVNPGWNHGQDATKSHPDSKIAFDPKYTTLLYLDLKGSGDTRPDVTNLKAVRIQFRSVGWPNGTNTWETNQAEIAKWINYLNNDDNDALQTIRPDFWVHDNPTYLHFNQPNHVAIYIRDKNVKYDNIPVWFSDVLIDKDENGKPKDAHENWSFFNAEIKTPVSPQGAALIGDDYSQEVLYMKNLFRHKSGWGPFKDYYKIKEKNPHDYSLNINALLEVDGGVGSQLVRLPIVLDPDTGNNGGGEPTAP